MLLVAKGTGAAELRLEVVYTHKQRVFLECIRTDAKSWQRTFSNQWTSRVKLH